MNKDELNKKYTDLKIKPLCSNQNTNMISNINLKEIDEYLETQTQEGAKKEDKNELQKGAKKEDQYGNHVHHQEASDEYMDENNSTTESGSTSTSPLPSMGLSSPRKLKLLKAERKLKHFTQTLASQSIAAKTDPNLEQTLEKKRAE